MSKQSAEISRPQQTIPDEDLEDILKMDKMLKKSGENSGLNLPRQQIPEKDIRNLLAGQRSTKHVVKEAPVIKPKEAKPKKKERSPARVVFDWIQNKRAKKVEVGKVVEEPEWSLPLTEKPQVTVPTNPEAQLAVEQKPEAIPNPIVKEGNFIPDPPPQKHKKGKSVAEVIREKKKEAEPKPVKKLTYEEAVEAYERQLAVSGKKIKPQTEGKSKEPEAKIEKVRDKNKLLSTKELRTITVISKLPGFIKSLRAKRAGVAFKIMCGIYQYEYIWVVKNKEDGVRFMKGLNELLNYEAIMEIYKKRHSEIIVIYARAKMEHRGRYSGTPLHPKLEERL